MNNRLIWNTKKDLDDNSFFEAIGMSSEEGDTFYYRIRKKLLSDKIIYIEDSDPKLLLDYRSPRREEWFFLEDAKYEMGRHFQKNNKI